MRGGFGGGRDYEDPRRRRGFPATKSRDQTSVQRPLDTPHIFMHRSQLLRFAALIAFAAALLAGCSQVPSVPAVPPGPQWVTLFDGKTLNGWRPLDGQAKFEVRDGCIVGTVVSGMQGNGFLATTDESFTDFVFECEFKCDAGLNSGIQFRSRPPDAITRRVYGYQYEIDPTPRALSGGIQEEGGAWRRSGRDAAAIEAESKKSPTAKPGAFWLAPTANHGDPQKEWVKIHGDILKAGDWNTARIEARGSHIRTWLNGQLMADLDDTSPARIPNGFFGLQVHRSENPNAAGRQVWFRNLRVQRLP
jgi:hypothetical protein